MKSNKISVETGVYEVVKNKKYQLNLRSVGAGVRTFEGTEAEAKRERARLSETFQKRRKRDADCPANMDGVYHAYLKHLETRFEHGESVPASAITLNATFAS